MKKILISGYYGYANSGDDAILSSICGDIQEIGREKAGVVHKITILSNSPEDTKNEYGVHAIYRFNFRAVRAEILKSDLVLMGGGSLLQDKTSTRSLFYYLWIIWYAKKRGKKCILYGNGIGPIEGKINRKLTSWIANKIDIITLREGLSKDELTELGIVKPKIAVTADPVFNLRTITVDVKALLLKEDIDPSKPMVAVLFRSWEGTGDYITKTAQLCDYIVEKHQMNVLLIPMKYPTDLGIAKEIQENMTHKAYVLKDKYDAVTLIEIIGATKLVLSMRLHALLYAALKSIPMIGFVYDPKVDYYLQELEMHSAGDIHTYDLEGVKGQIEDIFSHYETIQNQLDVKVKQLKEKSLQNKIYLKELMDAIDL